MSKGAQLTFSLPSSPHLRGEGHPVQGGDQVFIPWAQKWDVRYPGERASLEELPPSQWPVGESMEHFLD